MLLLVGKGYLHKLHPPMCDWGSQHYKRRPSDLSSSGVDGKMHTIVFLMWCDVTYSQVWWPILGIRALHLPIQVHTHSSEHTYTPWTHTRSSGQSFMLRCSGSSWGSVPCCGIEGGESAVHSLPPPTIPAGPRLKLATFRRLFRLSSDNFPVTDPSLNTPFDKPFSTFFKSHITSERHLFSIKWRK